MIIGPDQIVACPICNGLAKHTTLESGNTFGAIVWTDGKQLAPMLPLPPAVVKCRHCGHCYWLENAERLEEDESGNHPQRSNASSVEEVQEPTEEEYYEALEANLATDRDQERCLRMLAWWRSNDAFRSSERLDDSRKHALRDDNLDALLQLLDENTDDHHLMKAEVLRELGRFESATETLTRVESAEYATVVNQMRSLCERRERSVAVLQFED